MLKHEENLHDELLQNAERYVDEYGLQQFIQALIELSEDYAVVEMHEGRLNWQAKVLRDALAQAQEEIQSVEKS